MKVACSLEEFLPTPPYDLEFLRLNLYPPSTGYSDIVNGLFLTFHPKTLLVHSNVSCKDVRIYFFISFFSDSSSLPKYIIFYYHFINMVQAYIELCSNTVYSHCFSNSHKLIRFTTVHMLNIAFTMVT